MSGEFESRPGRSSLAPDTLARRSTDSVGKHTLTEHADILPVLRKADSDGKHTLMEHAGIPPVAVAGISGTGSPMPHRHTIQSLFGRHNISHIETHCDDRAAAATAALGAEAYATGSRVAFASSSPSLHTAAHEAAHVVQQGGGVRFAGGVARVDDAYEQHADAVADRVVNGENAEDLLDHYADASTSADPAVQMKSKGSKTSVAARPKAPSPPIVIKGPQMRPGNGTTAELQAELHRLTAEQLHYQKDRSKDNSDALRLYGYSIKNLNELLSERKDSGLPNSGLHLTFNGTILTIIGSSGGSWPAVSGKSDGGMSDFTPANQRNEGTGPIPAGEYWLDPSELRQEWLRPSRWTAWGTHSISIHPFASTRTFGRGKFFIHGGKDPGSAGCIDLTSNMIHLARALGSTPHGTKIKLTVEYPRSKPARSSQKR